ncbi:MAG: ribosome-associated translation inhibitor RaiA [Micrococcales bacterium]|nr:ribosome-associated translation inhibitor RaiA [Micrococcales bacterium]
MSDVAEIVVHGRHVEVSKRFREHVHNKLDRIDKFGIPLRRVDVEVSKEANPRLADRAFEVELTTRANGAVIRAEAAASDKYAALDIAYGRLEQRLRRAADKNRFHRHGAEAVRSPRAAGFDNLETPRPRCRNWRTISTRTRSGSRGRSSCARRATRPCPCPWNKR